MGCPFSKDNIASPKDQNSSSLVLACKTVILGEVKVGKTSIVNRLCNNRFSEDYMVTIGGSYLQKRLFISSQEFMYHLWDCCGDERYASLLPVIWKDAKAVLYVYDISNPESFHKISNWRKALLEVVDKEKISEGIVGNKSDLKGENCNDYIDFNEAKNFANENEMIFGEISAKNGDGIDYFFHTFAEKILLQMKKSSVNIKKKK